MRIVYAGAPEFSVAPLKSLTDAGFCVVAAVTQPDKPVGRKAILTPTPLKSYALSQGIPVYDFAKYANMFPNCWRSGRTSWSPAHTGNCSRRKC